MTKSDRSSTVSLASAIPFRQANIGIEFCLITTRRSGRWGFPKGRVDKQQSHAETALREALEEAGIGGRIVGDPLGEYTYVKKNKQHDVVAFMMEVESCLDNWEESSLRERLWADPVQARSLIERPNLIELLETALARLQCEQFRNRPA